MGVKGRRKEGNKGRLRDFEEIGEGLGRGEMAWTWVSGGKGKKGRK